MYLTHDEASVRKWLNEHPEAARSILAEGKTLPNGTSFPEKRKPTDTASNSVQNLTTLKKSKFDEPDPSEVFYEVTRIVQNSLDLETFLPRILAISAQAINGEKCSIFLFDRESNELLAEVWEFTNHCPTTMSILSNISNLYLSPDGVVELQDPSLNISVPECKKYKVLVTRGQGITGTVAATRKGLNIKDVVKGET